MLKPAALLAIALLLSACSNLAKNSVQTGQASWYGNQHHGKLTASGERFNQQAMTAAHRDLPFGSRVKVTHLNNQRSVIVRINDRGPYSRGRIIDLSRAAAAQLDMIRTGVAPVQLEIQP